MSKITAVTANTERTIVYSDFFTDFSRHINTGQLNKKTNEFTEGYLSIKDSREHEQVANTYGKCVVKK